MRNTKLLNEPVPGPLTVSTLGQYNLAAVLCPVGQMYYSDSPVTTAWMSLQPLQNYRKTF